MLYSVPVSSGESPLPFSATPRITTKAEAQDLVRRTERDILHAMTTPGTSDGNDSLAAQLAAYGDSLALAEQLETLETDSLRGSSASVLEGEPSRSYIRRPPTARIESAESGDTIVDILSGRGSSVGKQSRSASDSSRGIENGPRGFSNRDGAGGSSKCESIPQGVTGHHVHRC
jgi:hypothetical protein